MSDDFFWPALLFGAFICAMIGGGIGSNKNNGLGGFFLGGLLGPIGWVIVLMLPDPTMSECPECKGKCPGEAKRCRHCGVEFSTLVRRIPSSEFYIWSEGKEFGPITRDDFKRYIDERNFTAGMTFRRADEKNWHTIDELRSI